MLSTMLRCWSRLEEVHCPFKGDNMTDCPVTEDSNIRGCDMVSANP